MTIDDFNNLTIPEQEEALITQGTRLLNDDDQEHMACEVYKLFDFIVKLRYNSSKSEVCEVFALPNNDDFHLYEHHVFALIGEL